MGCQKKERLVCRRNRKEVSGLRKRMGRMGGKSGGVRRKRG